MKRFRDTDYFITPNGEVIRNGKTRKFKTTKEGYLRVTLYQNCIPKTYMVHRLVAECYIPNTDNLPQIDHKDFNKQNNNVDNLEWVTQTENTIRAYKAGRINNRNQYSN